MWPRWLRQKKAKMTDAYTQGFLAKCAEAGMDPDKLVKAAARFDQLARLLKPTLARGGIELGPVASWAEKYPRGSQIAKNIAENMVNRRRLGTSFGGGPTYRGAFAAVENATRPGGPGIFGAWEAAERAERAAARVAALEKLKADPRFSTLFANLPAELLDGLRNGTVSMNFTNPNSFFNRFKTVMNKKIF
jgi:hypothetical protein